MVANDAMIVVLTIGVECIQITCPVYPNLVALNIVICAKKAPSNGDH